MYYYDKNIDYRFKFKMVFIALLFAIQILMSMIYRLDILCNYNNYLESVACLLLQC